MGRNDCMCGAPCDYARPVDACAGPITVQDADAICPRHHCAKHKRIAHTARIPLPGEPEYQRPWGSGSEWEHRRGTKGQIAATNYCEHWHKPSGRRCGLRGGHRGEHWDGNPTGDAESAVSPPPPSPTGRR